MTAVDLTPFGFTPTESQVYQVLLEHGPGTGYAIARAANLARANAYSALAGLVAKGAAVGSVVGVGAGVAEGDTGVLVETWGDGGSSPPPPLVAA
ncbi:MAG: hypothetical protein IIA60_14340 [Candidatus Marinimicrobia bacterium]|nr:hypothetical protein [Candidatus Neomarinimicrobiota bacterium]